MTTPNKKVRVLSSEILHKGTWLTLKKDQIIKPDGTHATHEVVERNNTVMVVAFHKKKFCMVRMYRYAVDDSSWEFPMGFINPGEEPKKAAMRELQEETGLIANTVKPFGFFWASSGLTTQKIYVYFADKFT